MNGTIRPEISTIINDIRSIINGFEAFKSNYDDEHYDMFKDSLYMFAQGIDKIVSLSALNGYEKALVLPFLKGDCLSACTTLREYEAGRRNFLKVDYDIASATAVNIAPSSDITGTRQKIDDRIDDLSQGEQRQTADIVPIGLAAQQQPQQAEIGPIGQANAAQDYQVNDNTQDNTESQSMGQDFGPRRSLTTMPKPSHPNPFAQASNF